MVCIGHKPWNCPIDLLNSAWTGGIFDKVQAREEKLEAFIETIENNVDATLNFGQTVQKVLHAARPTKGVRQKVMQAME